MWAIRAANAFDGLRFVAGGATVFIEGETIAGVESGGCAVPSGVELTSYDDATLLPGLFDAHAHLVAHGSVPGTPGSLEWAGSASEEELDAVIERNLDAQAAAGVTTVRDLGDVGYRTLFHRDRRADGTPRIIAAGPPLTTPEGHCHFLGGVLAEPDDLERAVTERVQHGVDLVKVMVSGGMLTPGSDQLGAQFELEELRRLADLVHDAGLRITGHSHSLTGMEYAVAVGLDGIEHFTGLDSDGTGTPDQLLEAVAASGITVDPTLGRDPARVPPPELIPPAMRTMLARLGLTPEEMFRARTEQIGRIRAHGIRVVSGLDSGAAPMKPHGDVWRSVSDLVDSGYPIAEAVATATSVAADDCDVPAGRLKAGLSADLLVVVGDLAADVTALSHPVAVWVRGRPTTAARPVVAGA